MPAAAEGDAASLRVLLEVFRRRSALNGLDKPTVLQLEGPGDRAAAAGADVAGHPAGGGIRGCAVKVNHAERTSGDTGKPADDEPPF